MITRIRAWGALGLGLLVLMLPFSCSKEDEVARRDKVANVEDNDPEMAAAIAKARETLPDFWRVYENPEHGETHFCLKVEITDENGSEHFWLNDIKRRDGRILGTINNDPSIVKRVQLNERMVIPEADISDWLYMRNRKIVGNHTLRALFKTMSAEEVAEAKQMLAEP